MILDDITMISLFPIDQTGCKSGALSQYAFPTKIKGMSPLFFLIFYLPSRYFF